MMKQTIEINLQGIGMECHFVKVSKECFEFWQTKETECITYARLFDEDEIDASIDEWREDDEEEWENFDRKFLFRHDDDQNLYDWNECPESMDCIEGTERFTIHKKGESETELILDSEDETHIEKFEEFFSENVDMIEEYAPAENNFDENDECFVLILCDVRKGVWGSFTLELEDSEFDLMKLKLKGIECDAGATLTEVKYDGTELEDELADAQYGKDFFVNFAHYKKSHYYKNGERF